jgi:Cu+-exporting ATPase
MSGRSEYTFVVSGMHCPSCGVLIDDALEQVPGVLAARTDVAAERARVEVDAAICAEPGVLLAAITAEGYGAVLLP